MGSSQGFVTANIVNIPSDGFFFTFLNTSYY